MFFLKNYLPRHPDQKVLLLEWGNWHTRQWQVENQKNSEIDPKSTFVNQGEKAWNFNIGAGGGTNCWQGMALRMHPNDFRLKSLYGVGADWPISYDDIAEYYDRAEAILGVAGPKDMGRIFPGAGGYTQEAHHLSSAERILKAARPDTFFAAPSAKLSKGINGRGQCCNNATCSLCPTGAKFYAVENLEDVWNAPNLTICYGARVRRIEEQGSTARAVIFESEGKDLRVTGDLFVLGANGIHSSFILLQSGILDGKPGSYLGEKMLVFTEIMLDGHDHFDGGTATTGCETTFIDGEHRAKFGASMFWTESSFLWGGLRLDPPHRFRQVFPVGIVVEDLLYAENAVTDDGGDYPVIKHSGFSKYAMDGLDHALGKMPEIFGSLPVEKIEMRRILPTTDHIQGSLRMGTDPETSVIDAKHLHHRIRNLVVVGTSVFPTTSWAVPSLTCAAMSLKLGAEI